MSALTPLLERLRRPHPPPGAPAGVLTVPSKGLDTTDEVSFLFPALDAIELQAQQTNAAAQAGAEARRREAAEQRARILHDAEADARAQAAQLLEARRADWEMEAAALLDDAEAEARRILAQGEQAGRQVVAEVLRRIGGEPR